MRAFNSSKLVMVAAVSVVSVFLVMLGAFGLPNISGDVSAAQTCMTKSATTSSKNAARQATAIFSQSGDIISGRGKTDAKKKGKSGKKGSKGSSEEQSMHLGPVHFV